MKKDDIQQILIPPCDVKFVFFKQWHKYISPSQPYSCHVILLVNTLRRSSGFHVSYGSTMTVPHSSLSITAQQEEMQTSSVIKPSDSNVKLNVSRAVLFRVGKIIKEGI